MSFTFQLTQRDPPPRALFERLGLPALAWTSPPGGELVWPGSARLHIKGRSTRGVEVTWDEGLLDVRILIGSCPEDMALARAIVREAARRTGARICPEDGRAITVGQLDVEYGERWAQEMVDWGARRLRQLVFEQGTSTLIGPCRPFDLGGRIVRALDAAGPDAEYPERFFDAVRRLQYLDPQRYESPEATRVPLSGGRRVTAVLWRPSRGYLLPPVQYVHVHMPDGRPLFLPYEALPELPGVRAVWADERRLLVEPVPVEAWEDFWVHAAHHHVIPTGEQPD